MPQNCLLLILLTFTGTLARVPVTLTTGLWEAYPALTGELGVVTTLSLSSSILADLWVSDKVFKIHTPLIR